MQLPSSISYGFYRQWSQNDSTSNFFLEVCKMKKVEFFDFLFEPIGRWSVTFLSKCVHCMLVANSSRKNKVKTSSIKDGVRFSKAWKILMFAPLSDLWSITAIHHCTASISVLGSEGCVCDFIHDRLGISLSQPSTNCYQKKEETLSHSRRQIRLD